MDQKPQKGDRVRVTVVGDVGYVNDAQEARYRYIEVRDSDGLVSVVYPVPGATIEVLERKPVEGQLGLTVTGASVVRRSGSWFYVGRFGGEPISDRIVATQPYKIVAL